MRNETNTFVIYNKNTGERFGMEYGSYKEWKTARTAKDVEIEASHAADKAETNANLVKVGNILTEAFKAQ